LNVNDRLVGLTFAHQYATITPMNSPLIGGGQYGYEPPRLSVHGTVAQLTQASVLLFEADQSIPAGSALLGKASL
jgi:hypothetical protein